jgi:hypothetical protein
VSRIETLRRSYTQLERDYQIARASREPGLMAEFRLRKMLLALRAAKISFNAAWAARWAAAGAPSWTADGAAVAVWK